MKIDFDKIRAEYPLPDQIQRSGIKLEKDGNEFRACCPFHSEDTPSFTVYEDRNRTWRYHCFGCGAHGDVIDFVQEHYGFDNTKDAVEQITGKKPDAKPLSRQDVRETRNPYDGYDIKRPPVNVPAILPGVKTPPILNPKRIDPKTGKPKVVVYNPKMVFPYHDKNGNLVGYVLRVEFDGRKITPGIWWTVNKDAGFEGWSHGSFPAPRPLYGLDRLYAEPEKQVLLVEGEKCKDAAARLFTDGYRIVPVSWMGGGKSISKVHWKSLAARSVVIWPDNDKEGWRTVMGSPDGRGGWAPGIVDYLFAAKVKRVKIVHITPDSRADGWDIADAEAEGLDAKAVSLIMRDRIQEWTKERFEQWKAARIGADDNGATDDAGTGELGNESDPGEPPTATPNEPGRFPEDDPGPDADDYEQDSNPPAIRTQRGFEITEENWRSHLIYKADGDGLKATSLQNFALLLQFEPRFRNVFAWNEFAKEVYVVRRPPWDQDGPASQWRARKITDKDVSSATRWLEYCGMSPKINDIGKVIMDIAQDASFNPVTRRLDELVWDGAPRLTGGMWEGDTIRPWLSEFFGADNTPINMAFGIKWLVGAVARAYSPGCKLDTMLVLEGPQGMKKSSAIKVIADAIIPGIYTDEISDPNSKDAGLQMQGMLIIEIAELDAFRKAEITQIKSWLSRQTDRFRRPYGKQVEEFPRSCVFAGTVNPAGTGYLKDPTGARRFWPVRCHDIDLGGLKAEAEQLWAEAVHLYREGFVWWLDDDEAELANKEQEKRYQEDPWAQMIDEHLIGTSRTTILAIMQHLEIPKERRNQIVNARIAAHLHSKGWERMKSGEKIIYKAPDSMV